MNYTENYHLPQWEETDRVMRTDFNQMCADIEEGLSQTAAGSAETRTLTWDALLRSGKRVLAENLTQFDRDTLYSRNGLLFNPLANAEMAGTLAGTSWHEQLGVYAGRGEDIPEDVLRPYCTSCDNGTTPAATSKSIYYFTSPLTGRMKSFTLYLMTHFNSTYPTMDMTLTFVAEQASGNQYKEVLRKTVSLAREGSGTVNEEVPVEVNLPLTKDYKYRLTLTHVSKTKVSGRFGFVVQYKDSSDYTSGCLDHSKFQIVYPPITAMSHTRAFSTDGPASRALAVVRYRKEESTTTLTATIDGKAMTCTGEQSLQDEEGGEYQEAWYSCEKSFSGTAQFRIAVTCSETDCKGTG